jgi:hypothetical protein
MPIQQNAASSIQLYPTPFVTKHPQHTPKTSTKLVSAVDVLWMCSGCAVDDSKAMYANRIDNPKIILPKMLEVPSVNVPVNVYRDVR